MYILERGEALRSSGIWVDNPMALEIEILQMQMSLDRDAICVSTGYILERSLYPAYIESVCWRSYLLTYTPNSAFYPISNWSLQSEFLYLGYTYFFTSLISLLCGEIHI